MLKLLFSLVGILLLISCNHTNSPPLSPNVSDGFLRNQTLSARHEKSAANSAKSDNSYAKRYRFSNKLNGAIIEYYEVIDIGDTTHIIQERNSNLFRMVVGNQNADFETAEAVWLFFELF